MFLITFSAPASLSIWKIDNENKAALNSLGEFRNLSDGVFGDERGYY